MDHLEHLALTDMEARREYARELTRRGNVRGRLLALSIIPNERRAWLEIHDLLSHDDRHIEWLTHYMGHWTGLDLSDTAIHDLHPLVSLKHLRYLNLSDTPVRALDPLKNLSALQKIVLVNTRVSDLRPLENLAMLSYLNLFRTEVCDLSPLAMLHSLTLLYVMQTRVRDLGPIQHLIDAGLTIHGP